MSTSHIYSEGQINSHLKQWITLLSIPRTEIGGFSVCPFSKNTEYIIEKVKGNEIELPKENFELIIYVFSNEISVDSLSSIAQKYNKIYTNFLFLPDHKDRFTTINGIQTNNNKYNIILCQPKQNLKNARISLAKTNYYSFWDKKYLEEILGDHLGCLD